MALHGSVGPARTTISEVARRAGVQRMTVYNHFPSDADLFDACSTHWFTQHPPPNAAEWSPIADPQVRFARAVREMYVYYRDNERMLANVTRDARLIPALATLMADKWMSMIEQMVDVLVADSPVTTDPIALRAVVKLTLDFSTWQAWVTGGLGEDAAARLAQRLVAAVSS